VEKYYIPIAASYRGRTANRSELGVELSSWSKAIALHWSSVRFGAVNTNRDGEQHVFKVQVFFGGLDPNAVDVELYAEPQNNGSPFRQRMDRVRPRDTSADYVLYSARVPANRQASDYTARIIPSKSGVSVPLEANQILWHH
jgi:glycogen phosphorylase